MTHELHFRAYHLASPAKLKFFSKYANPSIEVTNNIKSKYYLLDQNIKAYYVCVRH